MCTIVYIYIIRICKFMKVPLFSSIIIDGTKSLYNQERTL